MSERGSDGRRGPSYRNALDSYMKSIRRYPLLTTSGEHRLAERAQGGSERAWKRLVQSNLRLVVKIAREYSNRGEPIEDLISEGNMGLMEAARRFDPTRGVRFGCYASWWIRKYVIAATERQRMRGSAPVLTSEPVDMSSGEVRALRAEGKEVPRRLMSLWQRIISFEEFPRSTGGRSPLDRMASARDPGPHERLLERQIADTLREVLGLLSERETQILVEHYGLDNRPPRSLQEIGDGLGFTREWVRQLERRAISRARRLLESKRFRH